MYAAGAKAMGVPGWPLLAAWTASMDKVRIVLMANWRMFWVDDADIALPWSSSFQCYLYMGVYLNFVVWRLRPVGCYSVEGVVARV